MNPVNPETTVTPLVSVTALPARVKLLAENWIEANNMPVMSLFVLVCVVPEKISAPPFVGATPPAQLAGLLQLLFPPRPFQV